MTTRLWISLIAISIAGAASANEPDTGRSFEIRKVERLYLDDIAPARDGTKSVELYLRVETQFGVPVEDLRAVDLVLRQDGDLIEPSDVDLTILAEDGRGAACVLAIDTSRTMKGEPFDRAKAAASAFLDRLGSFDRVAIVAFSNQAEVVSSFASARAEGKVLLDELHVNAESLSTVLYDGVYKSLELIRNAENLPRRRFVIVFSDGKDSGSIRTLEDVVAYGQGDELRPRTPISTIGYARFGVEGLETLQSLSERTAGEFFHATSTIHLNSFFNEIWRQMMHSYVVRFPTSLDGERHTIEVVVEGLSDRRTVLYPDRGGPVWPWIAGGVAVVVLLVGLLFFRRSQTGGRITFVGGEQDGHSVTLAGSVVRIGGLPENDVVITSPTVSRYHARIHFRRGSTEIEDLKSRNGTFVNGTPIDTAELHSGDKVRIGEVEMVYQR